MLGGLDRTPDGVVRVGGVTLGGCDDDALAAVRRESIGFVFQAFNLIPVLTAAENVALPGVIAGRASSQTSARASELLDLFGLADRAGQRPVELSGGEQQRVALARALFLQPAVLLADEPTGNLDGAASAEVMDVLLTANRELGQTVVLVTHDPSVAAEAHEVRVLRQGALGEPLRFSTDDATTSRRRRLLAWLDGGTGARRPARSEPLVAQ